MAEGFRLQGWKVVYLDAGGEYQWVVTWARADKTPEQVIKGEQESFDRDYGKGKYKVLSVSDIDTSPRF